MTRKQLIKFFNNRPYLSVRKVGIHIGYSEGRYLLDFLKSDVEDVSKEMYERILPVLKICGYGLGEQEFLTNLMSVAKGISKSGTVSKLPPLQQRNQNWPHGLKPRADNLGWERE